MPATTTHRRPVRVTLTMSPRQAHALAQMCKRMGPHHCADLSAPHDPDEAGDMYQAVRQLQRSLAAAGYAPR